MFLSDGKPSDARGMKGFPSAVQAKVREMGHARVDALVSRFGRRLTIATIGFGAPLEDFTLLKSMAARPAQFGCTGHFQLPSLTAEGLGAVFSSLTSSLTSTRAELSVIGTSSQRKVRDVRREARGVVDEICIPPYLLQTGVGDHWTFYHCHQATRITYVKQQRQ